MSQNTSQQGEGALTAQPSLNSHEEIKQVATARLLKYLGTLAIAVGTGVLAFTTDTVTSALRSLFNGSFKQCAVYWVPVDCPGGTNDPSVGICGCEDRRSLRWFRDQLGAFGLAHIAGFDGISKEMTLATSGADNSGLAIRLPDQTSPTWKLGVGYNAQTRQKDWCVHLYRAGSTASVLEGPVMCLDQSGRWWSRASDQDGPLTRTPAKLLAR